VKRVSALLLAVVGAGCATSGSVEDVESHVLALENLLDANEKALGKTIEHMQEIERNVKALEFRMGDIRARLDKVAPDSFRSGGVPSIDDIAGAPGLTQEERDKLTAFFSQLPTWAPEKALECSLDFKREALIPHLINAIRPGRDPKGRANALFVLSKQKPGETAALMEPALSDGGVRGDVLHLLESMEPHDQIRIALLKHSNEGDEAWRVTVAAALARSQCKDGIPLLIQFLYSRDIGLRAVAISTLKEVTGFDLGYKTYAGDDDRKSSAEKWEAWWTENGAGYVFPRR
jgi:hypothetical protein